jgi:hypothetical protein
MLSIPRLCGFINSVFDTTMVEIPWFGGFLNGACDTTTLGTVNGNLAIVEPFKFIQWLVPAQKKKN